MKVSAPHLIDALFHGSREEPSFAQEPGEELTRTVLSAEASRLRGLGLPIRLLPMPREGTRAALREYTLSLNQIIAGLPSHPRVWSFVQHHLPADRAAEFEPLFKAHFHPLWTQDELNSLDEREIHQEWRRRAGRMARWSPAFRAIRQDREFSEVWRSLEAGDFDVSGRGKDYTAGMQYFQAARAFGVECLLELLGLHANRGGLYLDVLGGDGYIMRILEATRAMREKRLLVLPVAHTQLAPGDRIETSPLELLLHRVLEMAEGVLVLLVTPPSGDGASCGARLIGMHGAGVAVGDPFELPERELAWLLAERSVAWLGGKPVATGLGAILRRVADELTASAGAGHPPLMVTNDISSHMFRSAGLWGFPTREDARLLPRTFREGSLDGVLFAYGTHHVTSLDEAFRASIDVLRPDGRIVVHDFLDEGQVGRWFHEVVDRHSRTGHDFPHLGPVQLAVSLYLAGFRNVELYEMEDPFVFSVPEESPATARHVAFTYLLGMYGMTESFGSRLDRFEELLHEVLSYPEIGNEPFLGDDLVYVPRRAVVVSARRPEDGPWAPLDEADTSLVRVLTGLLSAGPGWGVTPETRRQWLSWVSYGPFAGRR
ncbi:MAG TPA: methyltransferase domain-containing protein [Thermoanaerobaculia bacterium]|nr:methyltransferase domain-containing protein [Thermoanaerobaculia bacterium]